MLEDRSGGDIQFLAKNVTAFLEAARKRPEVGAVSTTFLPNVHQDFVDVDRDKVLKQGVALNDVYRTLQTFMGGFFVNYFNRFGRQWQVYIEADADDRARVENLGQFYVRNVDGENVPLSTLTTIKPRLGPEFTLRFNEYRAAQINGSAAPGYSADQATAALEDVFRQTMPREMGFEYSGISFQERKAREGVPPAVVFSLSLVFVFLMHGTTMVFLVAMPILFGFANYLVPLMVGARDMAFPRLNAFSFWLTAFGGMMLYFSFIGGFGLYGVGSAPDVSWWAYAPLTARAFSPGHGTDYWALALIVSGFGTLGTAINLIATIVSMRCKGMTLMRMPLYAWLMFVVSGRAGPGNEHVRLAVRQRFCRGGLPRLVRAGVSRGSGRLCAGRGCRPLPGHCPYTR